MNNIDIANGIVFQKMAISKESFDDRLMSQKKVYLLQSLGTDLGYTYNWYVRGPYSPSLTNNIYNNLEVLLSSDFSQYHLSETAENNIEKVNSLINSWKVDDNKTSLFAALMKQKPQFSEEQCDYAFQVLEQKGFLLAGA